MNDLIKNTVKKLFEKIKAKPYKYGFFSALIFLIIPILIWLFYLIGNTGFGIYTNINAGEALSFYGSFLAFIGTVVLGALALFQNKTSNDINNRLLKLEEQKRIPSIGICEAKEQDFLNTDLSNIIQFSLNDSKFYFNEFRKLEEWSDDIYVFKLRNINNCDIISVNLSGVTSKSIFTNYPTVNQEIKGFSYNTSIISLRQDSEVLLCISGIEYQGLDISIEERNEKEIFNQGISVILEFTLKNNFGTSYLEKIELIIFPSLNYERISYPTIEREEILFIKEKDD